MTLPQSVQGASPIPPDEVQPIHYCRGCGKPLPLKFRGHFHKDCLREDKRWRTSVRRRQEQERFKRWLAKRCR
jgi:hypothetical protein